MDGQRDNIFRKGIGMIITKNGEIVECFWRENGIVVKDGEFSICLEYDETQKMFTNPSDKRTEEYLTGQFG